MCMTIIIYGNVYGLRLILDSLLAEVIKSLSHFLGWTLMYDDKTVQTVNVLPRDKSHLLKQV